MLILQIFGFVLLGSILLIGFTNTKLKAITAIAGVLSLSVISSIPAIKAIMGETFYLLLPGSALTGSIPVAIDPLSGFFILLINFTLTTGVVYGSRYMQAYSEQKANLTIHWIALLMVQCGMLAACVLQNSFAFLMAWEVMAIAAFFLVIFDHTNSYTIKAGINYMIQTHIGVLFLIIGFLWVYLSEGSFEFSRISVFFAHHSNIWLFLLLFIGFGLKAGFIPLHTWLPYAHPAAPSHISGIMSGVIVKMGIYGILRTIGFMQADWLILGRTVLIISLLTGIYGIINAAVHRDYKRLLAYCTIENIGIIGCGIGLGMIGIGNQNTVLIALGFGSAILHTLNHAIFKTLLFYAVGSVYQQTHTRDMEKLGGLIKQMPQTALLFLTGAIAIGGLPPFCGFVSEFMLYVGFANSLQHAAMYNSIFMITAIAILSIIGGISVFAFTKSFGVIFLGTPRSPLHTKPVEVKWQMILPLYLIVGVMLIMAAIPVLFVQQAFFIVASIFPAFDFTIPVLSVQITGLMVQVGIYGLLFLTLIILLIIIRNWLANKQPVSVSPTWGCGYIAPKPNIQYTGKSFSKTAGKLLSFLVFEQKKYQELDRSDVFPKHRSHSSHYTDFFEVRLIDRVTNSLQAAMNRFQFIQNGQLQRYILFGLFFILTIFMCSVFNLL